MTNQDLLNVVVEQRNALFNQLAQTQAELIATKRYVAELEAKLNAEEVDMTTVEAT